MERRWNGKKLPVSAKKTKLFLKCYNKLVDSSKEFVNLVQLILKLTGLDLKQYLMLSNLVVSVSYNISEKD